MDLKIGCGVSFINRDKIAVITDIFDLSMLSEKKSIFKSKNEVVTFWKAKHNIDLQDFNNIVRVKFLRGKDIEYDYPESAICFSIPFEDVQFFNNNLFEIYDFLKSF